MAKKRSKKEDAWAQNGLKLEYVRAGDLKSHPDNWRRHSESQVKAFKGVLKDLGWIGYLLFNETTGRVLNGHMRKDAVPPDEIVPVLVGKWTPAQEKLILATHDPLAGMAEIDQTAARKLLEAIGTQTPEVQALLETLEDQVGDLKGDGSTDDGGDDDRDSGSGEGGCGDVDEKPAKKVKTVCALMVRCVDELEARTLARELSALGKAAKAVWG